MNNNKTVLITGASNGIGKELAYKLAKEGYDLVITARRNHLLHQIKKEIESNYYKTVTPISLDLSKESSSDVLYKMIKNKAIKIDILINNAGIGYRKEFFHSSWEKQNEILYLNIYSLTKLTYLFGKEMVERDSGSIVNLSSTASLSGGPYLSLYFASKAFILSFSEAIYEELKESNVNVITICPTTTNTEFEKRAKMDDSYLYSIIKPVEPDKMANLIYKSYLKQKPVNYCGWSSKPLDLASRIGPRAINRKIVKKLNTSKNDYHQ